MAWECPSANNSWKEITSALRNIINNNILLTLQHLSLWNLYYHLKTLGESTECGFNHHG